MYLEDFNSIEDIKREYRINDSDLEGVNILYAIYKTGAYEGESFVLFEKDNKLFIVNYCHCSCYGLAGGWHPVEITPESLRMEIEAKERFSYPDYKSFVDFCKQHFKWE